MTCSKCKMTKEVTEFSLRKDSGVYRKECKVCRATAARLKRASGAWVDDTRTPDDRREWKGYFVLSCEAVRDAPVRVGLNTKKH